MELCTYHWGTRDEMIDYAKLSGAEIVVQQMEDMAIALMDTLDMPDEERRLVQSLRKGGVRMWNMLTGI